MSDFEVALVWVGILGLVFFVIVVATKAPVAVSADDGRYRTLGNHLYVYEGDHICAYHWGSAGIAVIPKPAGGCE